MTTQLGRDIETALPLLPEHRKQSKRSFILTLDDLMDDYRQVGNFNANAFDLCLSSYRYHFAFENHFSKFRDKALKPRELKDLLSMAFAALLLRDQTPKEALVDTFVNVAKKTFGQQTTGLTNAYLRRVADSREELRKHLLTKPQLLLGEKLLKRWASQQALIDATSLSLLTRPSSHIGALFKNGCWKLLPSQEFLTQKDEVMALDAASYHFSEWVLDKIKTLTQRPLKILDACASPGGKLASLYLLAKKEGQLHSAEFFATEPKFKRLERLKENFKKMEVPAQIYLTSWGDKDAHVASHMDSEKLSGPFDVILADLPCTGLGTLASKPDLLLEDPRELFNSVSALQKSILKDLRQTLTPSGLLFVSLCSADPEELASIDKVLEHDKVEFWQIQGDNEGESRQWLSAWFARKRT